MKTSSVLKFQEKLVPRLMRAKPPFLAQCEFRPAKSSTEFKAAAHLVYLEYMRKKYTIPNKGQLRISIYQFLKKSTTLIALYKKKYIIGTMTLIEDSPLGLPMDKIYKTELDVFRDQGRNLVECGLLAMNDRILGDARLGFSQMDRMVAVLHFFKRMIQHLRSAENAPVLVCCFHPNHEFFYRGIQLEPLAGRKPHVGVEGSPAVAYFLDFSTVERRLSKPIYLFFEFEKKKSQTDSIGKYIQFKMDDFGEMFLNSHELTREADAPDRKHENIKEGDMK
jgi:hypothetical protein